MSTRTLDVTLPSDTLYVSGTVNGTASTWTNTEGQTWETTAARSANDVYVVALTIINSLGTATQAAFTLYYGLHLITDRTQADVDRWEQLTARGFADLTADEQAEWLAGMKGCYNAADLNRVGAAVEYLADRFRGYGYAVSVSPRLDWTGSDIPTGEDMARYLSDVSSLRSALAVMQTTPKVPADMEDLTYMEANDIEKILEDIDALLTRAAQAWFYSGEVYGGEV